MHPSSSFSPPKLLSLQGWPITILSLAEVHPHLNGNKYFKLLPYLEQAESEGIKTLLSFGGAFSNHLWAFANACAMLDYRGIAFVRGEELDSTVNERLAGIKKMGVECHFLSRQAYRDAKYEIAAEVAERLNEKYLIIPEGGTSEIVLDSCARIAEFLPADTQHVVLPVGSGGTMAGIALGMRRRGINAQLTGIGSFSAKTSPEAKIEALLAPYNIPRNQWEIKLDYRWGGFGKITPALLEYQKQLLQQYQLSLDPIYNTKAFSVLKDLYAAGELPNAGVVYVNTGGVWG